MEQRVKEAPKFPGAIGMQGDSMVILVGHDTDIATIAGALGIDWIADGRANDTPPGGALVFELWRSPRAGFSFVRVAFTTQTLEQMRNSEPLTTANPPAESPPSSFLRAAVRICPALGTASPLPCVRPPIRLTSPRSLSRAHANPRAARINPRWRCGAGFHLPLKKLLKRHGIIVHLIV